MRMSVEKRGSGYSNSVCLCRCIFELVVRQGEATAETDPRHEQNRFGDEYRNSGVWETEAGRSRRMTVDGGAIADTSAIGLCDGGVERQMARDSSLNLRESTDNDSLSGISVMKQRRL